MPAYESRRICSSALADTCAFLAHVHGPTPGIHIGDDQEPLAHKPQLHP
jgi:hypothetical protein